MHLWFQESSSECSTIEKPRLVGTLSESTTRARRNRHSVSHLLAASAECLLEQQPCSPRGSPLCFKRDMGGSSHYIFWLLVLTELLDEEESI